LWALCPCKHQKGKNQRKRNREDPQDNNKPNLSICFVELFLIRGNDIYTKKAYLQYLLFKLSIFLMLMQWLTLYQARFTSNYYLNVEIASTEAGMVIKHSE
jgi:hypothetical protein